MNKVLVTLLAGLVATGVYAADDVKKSRSDVKAEAATANMKGEIADGELNAKAASAEAKLSKPEMAALRAKVKAEASAANKKGEIADGDYSALAATAETKLSKDEMVALRAKVKAEAAAANKNGTIKKGNQ
jgi:hypothetical protein